MKMNHLVLKGGTLTQPTAHARSFVHKMRTILKHGVKKNTIEQLLICALSISNTNAQPIIYGSNQFVEYQVGTLPLVISVPHGGDLAPATIPDRSCNNAVHTTDAYTRETALKIKQSLYNQTGCYPHLIISHLKRSKLDPNRNISDGACGNQEASTAWSEFHNFINQAQTTANQEYNNKIFFVDLHGHGNPIQRIELGYLLYDHELELPDSTLNGIQYINYSSIKNLANHNAGNRTHAQLLRGPMAFGTLLSNHNFPSVPSQNIPAPGLTTNYYSGGYITANHTCYQTGLTTNGLQMELNYEIRNSDAARSLFAQGFTATFIEFMNTHFGMTWGLCTPLFAEEQHNQPPKKLYPNPVKKGEAVYVNGVETGPITYKIYNIMGGLCQTGQLDEPQQSIDTQNLKSGVFIVYLSDTQNKEREAVQLMID